MARFSGGKKRLGHGKLCLRPCYLRLTSTMDHDKIGLCFDGGIVGISWGGFFFLDLYVSDLFRKRDFFFKRAHIES